MLNKTQDFTVYVLDDDEDVRKSVRRYLETTGWKVTDFSSPSELLKKNALRGPGCLVLDLTMPEMNGIEVQRRLMHLQNQVPVIFLSGTGTIPTVVKAMQLGAVTFLEKPVDALKLREAIISAAVKSLDTQNTSVEWKEIHDRYNSLTDREKQISEFIVGGMLNKSIADRLNISVTTVKTHRASIFSKLGVKTAVDLTRLLTQVELSGSQK